MNMNCRYPRSNADVRLFCFPWAGSGAAFYAAWGKDIAENVEVHGYCLPGREKRYNEPCNFKFVDILDEIVKTIHEDYSDKPFMFFGHSMGSLLSFKAAYRLKELYGKQPQHMFLSGSTALHSPKRSIFRVKGLETEDFVARLKTLGGTPSEIIDDPDLMKIYLPPLQADFVMIEDIHYKLEADAPPPLSCPIDFFDGTEDKDHDIPAWKQLTSGQFAFHPLPGDHFYLKTPANMRKIVEAINLRASCYEDIV